MLRILPSRVFTVAACVLMTGCAFTNVDVPMKTESDVSTDSRAQGRSLAVVVPFDDRRDRRNRCGMKKNTYNMDTADVRCTKNPAEWIAKRFVNGLADAGYNVETAEVAEDASKGTIIQGELGRLFLEPKIGALVGAVEADMKVRLRVTSETGLKAERTFYIKGVEKTMVGTSKVFTEAFKHAADKTVSDMVAAIGDLIEEYPSIAQGEQS